MHYGIEGMPKLLDKIKAFGFNYSTRSGVTWGMDNVSVPEGKKEIVSRGRTKELEVISQYNDGLISDDERYRMVIEIWEGVKSEIEKLLPATLDPNGSVSDMILSGARGSMSNLTQMAGMKGLIINPSGRTIDYPIV